LTISSEVRKAGPYNGNDVTTSFPFSFKVFAASDMVVVRTDAIGAETTLTAGADYSVTLNADQDTAPGGSIVLPAPLASTNLLTITSSVPNLQALDLTNQGGFYPRVINAALDRLTILVQQVAEAVSRSLKTAISTPSGVNATLPAPVPYQLIGWNGSGTGFQNTDPTYSTALATDLASTSSGKGGWLIGFKQALNGAVGRTIFDKVSETVSVKDFGAVGDGVVDDTAAIQSAITATQGFGGRLFFPPGTYMVSSLSISRSLQVNGCGPLAVVKQKPGVSGNIFSITGTGINVMFNGMTFDGNSSGQLAQSTNSTIHSTAIGGTLADIFSLVVQDCEFRDSTYAAVRVQGDNNPATREVAWIAGNRFINGAAGVDNPGATPDYIPRDIALDDAVEAWVENNVFESDTAPATFGRSAIVVAQTQTATERLTELVIVGNRINRRGCNVSQNLGAIDLYIWAANCSIRDNIIKNSSASAIKWKQNSARLSITNNKIDSQLVAGAALNGNDPTYGSANDLCVVEGNQIANWDGATTGVITLAGYWSATTDYSLGIVCRNNQLVSCSGYQIQIVDTKAATVEGNQIYPASATIGINASVGNDGEMRIRNNYIGACSNYAIYTANSNAATFDALVDGNVIVNNANTYAAYIKARRVSFNGNHLAGCVNGVTFNTVTDLEATGNMLRNFSGTVGLLIDGVTNAALFGNSTTGITNGVFYNAAVTLKRDSGNTWNWAAATPAGGYYNQGDVVYNSAPVAAGTIGWVCTIAGTPGTWKTFGSIAA
jgi:hypothetical protein